jgi:SAM-dependent methyltransferase
MSFKLYYFKAPAGSEFSVYWETSKAERHFGLVEVQTTLPVVRQVLPKDQPILDAGCGLGRWVAYFRQHGYSVIGLDTSVERMATGREYAGPFPAVCASVLRTPFPDGTFGAVMCFGLVEHFEEGPSDALAELHRILRPGGILLVSVPYNNLVRKLVVNPLYRLRNLKRRLLRCPLTFNEYRFSAGELSRFLRETGFEVCGCYPDELEPPQCVGLFVDRLLLQGGLRDSSSWETGPAGKALRKVLDRMSPWLCAGGVLCVGRHVKKPDASPSRSTATEADDA